MDNLITFLLVGLVAGFLAGKFIKGKGFGILGNIILGIVGAFLGGFLLSLVGFETTNIIGNVITAFVGALVFLFLVGKFAK